MSHQTEVLIIGGGVIGVCAAYYLTEQGRSVTLIEKGDICAGSSYGNAGLVAPDHATPIAAPGALSKGLKWMLDSGGPFYIKPRFDVELLRWIWQFRGACRVEPMRRAISALLSLGQASAPLFKQLVTANKLDCGYEHKGRLFLFNTPAGLAEGLEGAHLLSEFGVETQELDAAATRALEPGAASSVIGGIRYNGYAHLVPDRFVRQLASAAERGGAILKTRTEALNFETSGGRITAVRTTNGDIQTEAVALAAGVWSPPLARRLGLRLPVQAAKGYSITAKRPANAPSLPLSLAEGHVAVTPMGELLRFSSTLELAGLDMSINQTRVNATRRALKEYLPDVAANLEELEVWRGLRPATPDSLPLIGRSAAIENLIIATGHGMLGLTHGPITGKLVAQLVAGETPSLDLTPFRPERFG